MLRKILLYECTAVPLSSLSLVGVGTVPGFVGALQLILPGQECGYSAVTTSDLC